MDPNACVDELYRILTGENDGDDAAVEAGKERAVDLASALQSWLGNGGFAPDADRTYKLSTCLAIMLADHWG